jgi:hypothetical protein
MDDDALNINPGLGVSFIHKRTFNDVIQLKLMIWNSKNIAIWFVLE